MSKNANVYIIYSHLSPVRVIRAKGRLTRQKRRFFTPRRVSPKCDQTDSKGRPLIIIRPIAGSHKGRPWGSTLWKYQGHPLSLQESLKKEKRLKVVKLYLWQKRGCFCHKNEPPRNAKGKDWTAKDAKEFLKGAQRLKKTWQVLRNLSGLYENELYLEVPCARC